MPDLDPDRLCLAPESGGSGPDHPPEAPHEIHPAYHRCLTCTHLGHTCGGPKLAALGSIGAVRAYHRLLRGTRGITVARVSTAAPQIAAATVQDYFGRGGQDPRWITVSLIDSALVAIIGNREGEEPLAHTCPAAIADVHDRNEALSRRLDEAEQEITRLTETMAAAEQSHQERLKNQRSDLQTIIDQQNRLIEILTAEKADYLRRIDAKSQELAALRADLRDTQMEVIRLHSAHAAEIRDIFERMLKLAAEK